MGLASGSVRSTTVDIQVVFSVVLFPSSSASLVAILAPWSLLLGSGQLMKSAGPKARGCKQQS